MSLVLLQQVCYSFLKVRSSCKVFSAYNFHVATRALVGFIRKGGHYILLPNISRWYPAPDVDL